MSDAEALPTWSARASSVGYYLTCSYRAAFDRAISTGIASEQVQAAFTASKGTPSPYADFGTCVHFVLQDGIRATFPGKPVEYAPTEAEWLNAAKLFGDDLAATQKQARTVATLAGKHLPSLPAGVTWLAEKEFVTPIVQGHIDFLSSDGEEIWDLKTTTRIPEHNRIKPEHMYQLVTYHLLSRAKRGGILYVDMRANWALPIPVDFTTPEMVELAEHTLEYLEFIRGPGLFNVAIPQIGPHCAAQFCPYSQICRDRYIPMSREVHYAHTPRPSAKVASIPGLSA